MPSKKQYNLVSDDTYDSRIPLYNEEAFQHGITFHAKYIGSLDVPRPSSRVEIVAAMRRIRYEFKAKSMKKKKVGITVSVDGVKVVLRSKRRSNQWPWDENKFIIMHHPIYRIFYVSHDSQDLKIFSYIARDGGSNAFKCNVFKSKKKSQAMRIVRTIGQAFEVCHKLSLALASNSGCGGEADVIEDNNLNDPSNKGKCQGDGASEPNSCDTQEETSATKSPDFSAPHSPLYSEESDAGRKVQNEPLKSSLHSTPESKFVPESSSLSVYHNIQMLREQLEQQHQQMQSVVGQVQLLKDQLSAETTARLEAQSQNHQLLAHNRELLEHIKRLVNHIQEMEQRFHGKEQNGNSQPGSFPSFSTSESNTAKNSEKNTGNKNTPDNITIQDDPFSMAPLPKNIFGRQLSIPANNSPGGGSPRSGTSPRDSCHSAMSLPADSPSQRCNFRFDSDAIFRSDSFACSSPKPSRKDVCSIPISSPTFLTGGTTSPAHLKSGSHQAFDFDAVESYGGTASLFKYNNGVEKDSLNARPNAKSPFRYGSSETAVNSDSFIAQVARDLAKMSTFDRDATDVSHNSPVNSGFSTLFKS